MRKEYGEHEEHEWYLTTGWATRYSQRSATIGSTFVALRAGIALASSATVPRKQESPMNVSGSKTLTPKNMSGVPGKTSVAFRIVDTPAAPASPKSAPRKTGRSPSTI